MLGLDGSLVFLVSVCAPTHALTLALTTHTQNQWELYCRVSVVCICVSKYTNSKHNCEWNETKNPRIKDTKYNIKKGKGFELTHWLTHTHTHRLQCNVMNDMDVCFSVCPSRSMCSGWCLWTPCSSWCLVSSHQTRSLEPKSSRPIQTPFVSCSCTFVPPWNRKRSY